MRVVVDTNIFVSAAIKRESLPNLALYQASHRCVLLKFIVTDAQLLEVIARAYIAPLIKPETRDWLTQLMKSAGLFRSPSTSRCAVIQRTTSFLNWP